MKNLSNPKQKVKSANEEVAVHNAVKPLSQDEIFEKCVVPLFGLRFTKRDWFICEPWAGRDPDAALETLRSPGHTPRKIVALLRFFLRHHPGLPAVIKEAGL